MAVDIESGVLSMQNVKIERSPQAGQVYMKNFLFTGKGHSLFTLPISQLNSANSYFVFTKQKKNSVRHHKVKKLIFDYSLLSEIFLYYLWTMVILWLRKVSGMHISLANSPKVKTTMEATSEYLKIIGTNSKKPIFQYLLHLK